MKYAIEINHLTKSYNKQVKAVDDISFKVEEGQLFAFLGINGAGKSTTISMICGNLEKDHGEILVEELDLDSHLCDVKSKLGVVFQDSALDKVLSVKDNLKSRAALYGIVSNVANQRIDELATLLDFKDILNRPLDKLSGGQKRRIDIARAILHKPSILILDEPTTGLDPKTRKLIWNVIDHLRETEKMTIFLTTHYMEEAANANHIVIINKGKIVAKGSPLELKNQYVKDYIHLYHVSKEDVEKLGMPYIERQDGYQVFIDHTKVATDLILKYPSIFNDYEVVKGNMDDVFLNVTGITLEEM